MTEIIELNNFNIVFLENSKLLLTKNEPLCYSIKGNYNIDNLIMSVKNGNLTTEIKAKNNTFEIPKEFMFAGKLEMVLTLFEDCKIIKKWRIEPLIITELNEQFDGIPEIKMVENKITELEKTVQRLTQIIDKKEKIKKLFAKVEK